MTKIFKFAFLLLCSVTLFTACSDDNSENPVLKAPTTFRLNTPELAANGVYDLAHSTSVELTCTQPDYGFPAVTKYTVMVGTKADMSDEKAMTTTFTTAKMNLDAKELAILLTNLFKEQGHSKQEFPLDVPVYIRVKAVQTTADSKDIEGTAITSNTITLNKVHLEYSIPSVQVPKNLYIVGNFNNWNWNTSLTMTQVNSATNIFWHLVYIGGTGNSAGIKFNTDKTWDIPSMGYDQIVINKAGDKAGDIINTNGNIGTTKPGWYLMIVECSIEGNKLVYNVTFNEPNVYLMGHVTKSNGWDELQADAKFSVPEVADADFVSPEFSKSVAGGDDHGVRVYVKIPDFDWWKSEFIVYDGKIAYRGNGGDQTPRVAGAVGQKVYLNFTKETGEIK